MESQDLFDMLPNEKIYEICESLDAVSLLKLMQTQSRIYGICDGVLQKKKEDFLLEKKIRSIIDNIKNTEFPENWVGFEIDYSDSYLIDIPEVKKDINQILERVSSIRDLLAQVSIQFYKSHFILAIQKYVDEVIKVYGWYTITEETAFNILKNAYKNNLRIYDVQDRDIVEDTDTDEE